MAKYIRHHHPGGTYFFTSRLSDRKSALLVEKIDQLRRATRLTMQRHPFTIDAVAVLPGAIHTIWTLPPGDSDFSRRWAMLKSLFSKSLPAPPTRTPAQIARGQKGIWQPRFWEHLIRDAADLERHRMMIHASPVQAGLCPTPLDWPHSSVHRDVATSGGLPAGPGHGAARLPLTSIHAPTYREEGFANHP